MKHSSEIPSVISLGILQPFYLKLEKLLPKTNDLNCDVNYFENLIKITCDRKFHPILRRQFLRNSLNNFTRSCCMECWCRFGNHSVVSFSHLFRNFSGNFSKNLWENFFKILLEQCFGNSFDNYLFIASGFFLCDFIR